MSAKYGDKFLGMTWAATGLLLLGSIACFINVFVRNTVAVAEAPPKEEEEA